MELLKSTKNHYSTILFVLLIVGFLTIGIIPAVYSIESRIVTIPFRATVLCISLYIIASTFFSKQSNTFGKAEFFFILFWIFYFIKAIISYNNYVFSETVASLEIETYLRIIGICFIPSLAVLMIREEDIDYNKIFKIVYYVLFILLLLNILVGIKHDNQGRTSGFFSMYSISFGHIGVSLALLSVYKILYEEVQNKFWHLIPFFGIIIGTFIMYTSGTRSPLIAYVLCLSFIFYAKNKLKYLSAFIFLLVSFAISLIYFKPHYDGSQSSSFFSRVAKMIVSGDSSGRGELYQKGIAIFTENPIFGGRILYFDGMYPHNIFLEILMAMGIFGMILYFFFVKNCLQFILKIKKHSVENVPIVWIVLLWLQYFILSLFSYNIHSSPEIWYFTAMILVLNNRTNANNNSILQ